MMSDPEREYLEKHGPEKAREVNATIERIWDFDAYIPLKLCTCHDEQRCPAHLFAFYCAEKNQPERLERFVALVTRWRAKRA